jgi:hypothetical protein
MVMRQIEIRRGWGLWLASAVLFNAVPPAFSQNLVADGSFETPYVTNATKVDYPTNMSLWRTTTTNFEVWTNGWKNPASGLGPLDSADGHQNLELLSEGTNVTVWQTVPTVPGERYSFSFHYSPRPNSSSDRFSVTVNSNLVLSVLEDGDGLSNFDWQQFTTNFIANSNLTTLAFTDLSLTGGGSGTHIDGVVLQHEPWLTIENTGDALNISWFTVSNETYQLQFRTNLTAGTWTNLGSPVSGNGAIKTISVTPIPDGPVGFFRVGTGP